MTLRIAVVAALASLAVQQRPVFQTSVEAVAVPVAVVDGRRPVSGLKSADFRLVVDGTPQAIGQFYSSTVPLDVSLVVDTSGSVEGAAASLKRDITRIVGALDAQDRVRVLAIDSQVHQDVALQPATPAATSEFKVRGGFSSIHDALLAALLVPPVPDRRQIVLAITDGYDTASVTDAKTLLHLAGLPGPALHIVLIKPANQSASIRELARRQWAAFADFAVDDLAATATATGGALHRTGLLRTGAVSYALGVLDHFRQSYVLVFAPSGVSGERRHTVEVTVPKHPGWTVTSRRTYESDQ